jgi:hypothetical protein
MSEKNSWERLGPGVLSVDLTNEDHEASIYISDDTTYRNKLTLKIKNVSNGKIVLQKGTESHLEVFFPKGVLDENNLPKPNQVLISEWTGMGGKDIFNLDAIEDKPLIDLDKLNAQTKLDVSGMVDAINGAEMTPSDTATRGLRSRNVTKEEDLTKLVKESNELKKQIFEELKDIKDNKQLSSNPIIKKGLAQFADLFKKISDVSAQVDTNIEVLYDLQKRVEQGREFAKEEIFTYIQDELGNGIKTYLESLEGQKLFNNQIEFSVKDILANFEGLQLSDSVSGQLSSPKAAAGWNVDIKTTKEGVVFHINKTSEDTIHIGPGDYLKIDIANIKPNAESGTRNTTVELRYANIKIEGADKEMAFNRFSQTPLNIVNRRGQKYASVQLSIVKGQMLLNDGTTPNEIILRLINTGQDSIYFKNAGLGITYEVQQEGEDESYALTEKDDIITINLSNSAGTPLINVLNGGNSFDNTSKVGQNPSYEFTVSEDQNFELKPGDYWIIAIKNLKTGLPAGSANVQFNYFNVPEYWDGAMAVTLERSPLVFKENSIGVGTLEPTSKIHVKGNGSLIKLEGADQSYVEIAAKGDKQISKIGYLDAKNEHLSIENKEGNINFSTKENITVDNDIPFQFKRFKIYEERTPTNYSARDWNAGIVGLGTDIVDFQDRQGADIFRMEISDDGNWEIRIFRDFSSTDGQNGSIDVMFVSRKLSTRIDWR